MDFAAGIKKAYSTKWSYINTFKVQFFFTDFMKKHVGWTTEDENNLSLNVKSINTPQFTNQPIEVYVADQWKIHNGRNEMFRFSMTFRDQDQLSLYRKFVNSYNWQRTAYFDQCKMKITIYKDADYIDERDKVLFNFENVLIEGISQLQFSNETEAQIVEFDVEFKCTLPLIEV